MKPFLFIKPQKTATFTIRFALQPYTLYSSTNGISINNYTQDIKDHLTYLEYIQIIGEQNLHDAVIFGTIRNPFERMVSWWKWERSNLPLDEYAQSYVNLKFTHKMVDFFKGIESSVTYVRFENLQRDFNLVCDKIGIPNFNLTIRNNTQHDHYTTYYTDNSRKKVEQLYAEDLEYFNYKFGD